jgi:hypothetical protein
MDMEIMVEDLEVMATIHPREIQKVLKDIILNLMYLSRRKVYLNIRFVLIAVIIYMYE